MDNSTEFDKNKTAELHKHLNKSLKALISKVESVNSNKKIKLTEDDEPELEFEQIYEVFENVAEIFNELFSNSSNQVNMEKLKKKMSENIDHTKILDGKIMLSSKKKETVEKNHKKLKGLVTEEEKTEWSSKEISSLIKSIAKIHQ